MVGEPANPLREVLEECRIGIVLLTVFSLFTNVLILTSPIYMMQVYDRVLSSGRLETLVLLTVIAGVAVLVLGLLEMVRIKILARIGQWLDWRLSPELIGASLRAAIRGGSPNVQPLRDLTQIKAFLGGPGCNMIFDVLWMPIFLTLIWLMQPILGLVGIVSATALFILAAVNEYTSRKPFKQSGAMSIANTQSADQAVRNADAFHAMGMLPGFLAGWTGRNERSLALQLSAADRNATLIGFSKFVRIFVQVLILGAGAYLVIDGRLTAGGMIAASTAGLLRRRRGMGGDGAHIGRGRRAGRGQSGGQPTTRAAPGRRSHSRDPGR